jgi:hypothetical protein
MSWRLEQLEQAACNVALEAALDLTRSLDNLGDWIPESAASSAPSRESFQPDGQQSAGPTM